MKKRGQEVEEYIEETGNPFTGKKKEELKVFLEHMGLTYDEQISHSIVLREGKEIIATASCQKNVIKCVAISEKHQGQNLLAYLITSLNEYFFRMGISHFFGFTKPKNKELFCNMGLYPVAQTANVLLLENDKNGLEKFLDRLKRETQEQQKAGAENEKGDGIASVVMNCNPFTRGHEYLIREAAQKSKWLHIFILSEEQEFLTTKERYQLVKEGICEITNVILHQTSEYMVSPVVFPTYFIKEKAKAYEMNCELDIRLFGKCIAPELGITDRYVGSEPVCEVTRTYNKCLREQLPWYQIRFHEIPRKTYDNQVISASEVRKKYAVNQLESIRGMLPESTRWYLERKKDERCKRSFSGRCIMEQGKTNSNTERTS